jgi:polyisoprenoid-binding protein YceI
MNRTLAVLALATGLAVPSAAPAAATLDIDRVHSAASFQIRHIVSKVSGRFTDFSGTILADAAKPEASSVEFTVKTASIDTAQANRDKHLQIADFFDVEKFPEITFKSTSVKSAGKDKYDVTGNLTMHGVTKQVTLPVTHLGSIGSGKDLRHGFETTTTLNRKDYGIVWNKALDTGGYMLGDDVTVTINLTAVPPKPPAAN